jgi:hypothetical protein
LENVARLSARTTEDQVMTTRTFAPAWGYSSCSLVFPGLIPGALQPAPPGHDLAVDALHGRALGLFEVNILHTLVHLIFGIWGLIAYRSWDAAKTYAKSVAVIYIVFAVMGVLPAPINTTFGLVPLHGNDVWLHVLLAAPAAYFGFLHSDNRTTERT